MRRAAGAEDGRATHLITLLWRVYAVAQLSYVNRVIWAVPFSARIPRNRGTAMTIMPVGSIVAFGGTRKPDGWLWCDGSTIPSGTDYSDLRKLLGQNKTPDLRGYFLRGLDTSRQIDPGVSKGRSKRLAGRTLLSTQGDAVGPHAHDYLHAYYPGAGKSGAGNPPCFSAEQHASTGTPLPAANVGNENRPINVAVNYIIKAFDEG
ncbi:MAG: tail fiber protein [Pseudolabrys sp.]|nr:tail fiber protein [Pseudolabrys sp.]